MNRRRWLLLFTVAVGITILVPLALGVLLIDRHPLLDETPATEVDDAVRTRELAKRTWKVVKDTGGTLRIEEGEVNSAFAFVSRGTRRVLGRARVAPDSITVTFTLRLPATPFGEYLNGWITIPASGNGLHFKRLVLGDLMLPGAVSRPLLRLAMDLVLGDNAGTFAFATVRAVDTDDRAVVITLRRVPDLKQRLDRIKDRFKRVRDQVALLGDPALVRRYYLRLIETDRSHPRGAPARFTQFLPPLFQLARERAGDPVAENRAAVLALAMFLGSQRFGSFVGPVHTDETREYMLQHRAAPLFGRTDLRLHFLVSAGMKVVADSGVSHAVGEFKELMDARRDGSGFSFADLAADRAGVRFAETALDPAGGAARMQRLLAGGVEDPELLPDPSELPEGLTREEFAAFFGNMESPAYRTLVAAIDTCVGKLALHEPETVAAAESPNCDIQSALPAGLAEYLDVRRAKARQPASDPETPPRKPPAPKAPVAKLQREVNRPEDPPTTAPGTGAARPAPPGTSPVKKAGGTDTASASPRVDATPSPTAEPEPREESQEPAPREVSAVTPAPAVVRPSAAERELTELHTQLKQLLKRYTSKHPDVRALQLERWRQYLHSLFCLALLSPLKESWSVRTEGDLEIRGPGHGPDSTPPSWAQLYNAITLQGVQGPRQVANSSTSKFL